MKSDLDKYLAMKTALVNERAKLEARLKAINKVLGADVSVADVPSPATTITSDKRTFSAATKAKMAAAQKARWAKKKAKTAPAAATVTPPAPKKKKRKYSAEAKARMAAGAKARWAKVKMAGAGKTGK